MLKTLLAIFMLSLFTGATSAPAPATATSEGLDAAVRQYLGAGFNGVVLVRAALPAAPVVRAYGLADMASQRPLTPETPFQIGSISKWLSAVTVLRLVDQGKLALDTPISTYLPELPAQRAGVTLRHLLSNSAGIPNGVMQAFKQDKTVADLRLNHLEASLRFAGGAPLFAPGNGWDYSPTTWVVVAAIIERVSGEPFAQAVQRLLLGPAGASATAVPLTPFKDMPGAAQAYRATLPRQQHMSPHVVFVAASGTLYSTAADLARLATTVYETPLLSAKSRAELLRIIVKDEQYALGGRVKTLELGGRARTVAWESGVNGGYKSLLVYVPGDGKTVVILNNTDMPQSEQGQAAEALLRTLY